MSNKVSQAQKDKYYVFSQMQNLDLKKGNMNIKGVLLGGISGKWEGKRKGGKYG
jgi:hypothetical protein